MIFIGGMLHASSCFIGSFLTNSTYFIMLYGILGGIASGLVYMLPIRKRIFILTSLWMEVFSL